jgi:4-amino-4-deoxy-L-arabinose transferase-like glycosyltransferase
MEHNLLKNSALLFIFALLVRGVYTFIFVEIEFLTSEDQMGYIQYAKEILHNGFLGITSERVPGYPFFISVISSVFGESLWNVIAIQVLLDSASCILIAIMAKVLFGAGFWIAGVMSAINLNMIIISNALLTDTLFLFLFTVFLFALIKFIQNERIGWFIIFVTFLSLSALVRPASYYLIPLLLISVVIWRLWLRDNLLKVGMLSLLYLLIASVLLGGIHQRNLQEYGSKAFVSQSGTHLLGWVVPATYQYSGQGSYQEGQKLARDKLNLSLRKDQLDDVPSNPFESSLYKSSVAKGIFIEFGYIKTLKAWFVGSAVNLFAPSVAYAPALRSMEHPSFYETKGNGIVEKLENYIKSSNGLLYLSILTLGTIISLLFNLTAFIGAYKMALVVPNITLTKLIIIIGYFLAITGPVIGVKYRLPIEPILIMFFTYSILSWKYFDRKNLNP